MGVLALLLLLIVAGGVALGVAVRVHVLREVAAAVARVAALVVLLAGVEDPASSVGFLLDLDNMENSLGSGVDATIGTGGHVLERRGLRRRVAAAAPSSLSVFFSVRSTSLLLLKRTM